MHTLLAAFFTCLFGFNHAPAKPAVPAPASETRFVAPVDRVPNRYELAQSSTRSGYAESACVSCRRIDATFRTR